MNEQKTLFEYLEKKIGKKLSMKVVKQRVKKHQLGAGRYFFLLNSLFYFVSVTTAVLVETFELTSRKAVKISNP